jgi:hypothetical protein
MAMYPTYNKYDVIEEYENNPAYYIKSQVVIDNPDIQTIKFRGIYFCKPNDKYKKMFFRNDYIFTVDIINGNITEKSKLQLLEQLENISTNNTEFVSWIVFNKPKNKFICKDEHVKYLKKWEY